MDSDTSRAQPIIEARSIDWVPTRERHGKLWHQAPLWFLGNFQYFTIPIGFIGPGLGLSVGWTILAGTLGIVVGTFFMAFHGSQGPRLGLPQMIQSRAQFGYRGVIVVLFAALFTYVAFNVTDQVLLADGLSSAYGWNAEVVAVGSTLIAATLAILGHDWVHRAFRALLIASFPFMAIVSVAVLLGSVHGSHVASSHLGFTTVGFMAEFSASAAYNITYAPYVSDYSRYLPVSTPTRRVIASVFFGASASAVWLIALGAWLAVHLNAQDGLTALRAAGNGVVGGLGSVTAILSAAALVATMGMNAYGGSLTLLTAIDSVRSITPSRRWRLGVTVVLTVVWFAIAEFITQNAVNTVATALTLMLYLLVPWTATNLVDFFVVRRGHYAIRDLFTPTGIYGAWSARGLIAYAIGFASEVPFMVLGQLGPVSYTGPVARALGGVDISWIVGLVATAVAYLVLARLVPIPDEAARVAASDAWLDTIEASDAGPAGLSSSGTALGEVAPEG